jgi:hypothetical protein
MTNLVHALQALRIMLESIQVYLPLITIGLLHGVPALFMVSMVLREWRALRALDQGEFAVRWKPKSTSTFELWAVQAYVSAWLIWALWGYWPGSDPRLGAETRHLAIASLIVYSGLFWILALASLRLRRTITGASPDVIPGLARGDHLRIGLLALIPLALYFFLHAIPARNIAMLAIYLPAMGLSGLAQATRIGHPKYRKQGTAKRKASQRLDLLDKTPLEAALHRMDAECGYGPTPSTWVLRLDRPPADTRSPDRWELWIRKVLQINPGPRFPTSIRLATLDDRPLLAGWALYIGSHRVDLLRLWISRQRWLSPVHRLLVLSDRYPEASLGIVIGGVILLILVGIALSVGSSPLPFLLWALFLLIGFVVMRIFLMKELVDMESQWALKNLVNRQFVG